MYDVCMHACMYVRMYVRMYVCNLSQLIKTKTLLVNLIH